MSKVTYNKIITLLDEKDIEYTTTKHKEVRTSLEAAKVRGVDIASGAKALVIKIKKDIFVLVVLQANKKINWKKLKSYFNVNKPRMATIEEAEKLTNCKVGGIPPFGNVLKLKTYFDKSIEDIAIVNFNAGLKTHSIQMKTDDLIKITRPTFVDLID